MKRLICVSLFLMLLTGAAFASQAYECEMTENEVLTVRLDANATTGYEWDYKISDESLIDMITNEYTVDDETLDGTGGQFVVSFKAIDGATGDATIVFNYSTPSYGTAQTVILGVRAEDGSIFLDSDDCLDVDDGELTVTLDANATTGYEWNCAIDDESLFVKTSEEYIADDAKDMAGVGGKYKAVFEATMDGAGMVTLTFGYSRPWENALPARTIKASVWIIESGDFYIDGVEAA